MTRVLNQKAHMIRKWLTWSLVVAPLSGMLAGWVVAYVAFFQVSANPEFSLFHGAPLGLVLVFLYGLIASPFAIRGRLMSSAFILFTGTVLSGLIPAAFGAVPFALFGSMLGGFWALVYLVYWDYLSSAKKHATSDAVTSTS